MTNQIPKLIHYFWFGYNEKSPLIKKCIDSWKNIVPDYTIIEWNESTFDVNQCLYAKQAYEQKKYAFVSDFARLKILHEYGGIYLDTDVELIKPLDELLHEEAFMGFESNLFISPGCIIGAQKNNVIIKYLLDYYYTRKFLYKNNQNLTTIGEYTTYLLKKIGIKNNGRYQKKDGITIYPREYFSPISFDNHTESFSNNTYSVHHYMSSWKNQNGKAKSRVINYVKLWLKLQIFLTLGENTYFKLKFKEDI